MEEKNQMEVALDEREQEIKKMKQLEHRKEKIKAQNSKRARSKRTHRLIVRGAMLESFLPGGADWSEEDVRTCLERVTETDAFYEFLNERNVRNETENAEEN